jgi:hypothetical protein
MNEQIVEDALADIAMNPDGHNQRQYACGTTMCLAGFIAVRAGYTIDYRAGLAVSPDGEPESIFWVASEAAGMTEPEAAQMFISSAMDDYKQLVTRWNRLKGTEQ